MKTHACSRLRVGLATLPIALAILACALRADENIFGYVKGVETVPQGHTDFYTNLTARTGKNAGSYRGYDAELEAEYGFTNELQGSLTVINHYFDIKSVAELDDQNRYCFGGVELAAKYRLCSPFKDGYGFAIRPELGYLRHDDVAGIIQREFFVAGHAIWQRNFRDDTIILAANAGLQLAWGKRPAEEYDYELALEESVGASYRFAPNWFFGVEEHLRAEYPNFNLGKHEHTVLFAGPSLHYGSRRWWATITYVYQVWGNEVNPVVYNKAYAEEARNEYRVKIGFNF